MTTDPAELDHQEELRRIRVQIRGLSHPLKGTRPMNHIHRDMVVDELLSMENNLTRLIDYIDTDSSPLAEQIADALTSLETTTISQLRYIRQLIAESA